LKTLAQLTSSSPAAPRKHLAELRLAGWWVVHRDGRHREHAALSERLVQPALHNADQQVTKHADHL
jgi:hypothetical protein